MNHHAKMRVSARTEFLRTKKQKRLTRRAWYSLHHWSGMTHRVSVNKASLEHSANYDKTHALQTLAKLAARAGEKVSILFVLVRQLGKDSSASSIK
jgi:hypothetical protein